MQLPQLHQNSPVQTTSGLHVIKPNRNIFLYFFPSPLILIFFDFLEISDITNPFVPSWNTLFNFSCFYFPTQHIPPNQSSPSLLLFSQSILSLVYSHIFNYSYLLINPKLSSTPIFSTVYFTAPFLCFRGSSSQITQTNIIFTP